MGGIAELQYKDKSTCAELGGKGVLYPLQYLGNAKVDSRCYGMCASLVQVFILNCLRELTIDSIINFTLE